jgi:hypothetical protein
MKRLITFFAFCLIFLIALMCSSCAPGNWYWTSSKNTGIETLQFVRAGWQAGHVNHACSAYFSNNPIKPATLRRYHSWTLTKN